MFCHLRSELASHLTTRQNKQVMVHSATHKPKMLALMDPSMAVSRRGHEKKLHY
jgi:hypothetical protein